MKLSAVPGMRIQYRDDTNKILARGYVLNVYPNNCITVVRDGYVDDPGDLLFVRNYIDSWWEPET